MNKDTGSTPCPEEETPIIMLVPIRGARSYLEVPKKSHAMPKWREDKLSSTSY